MNKFNLFCIAVLCTLFSAAFAGTYKEDFFLEKYKNRLEVTPEYTIYWTVKHDELQLGLYVFTSGWIGFGIAEPYSGGMAGADILVGYVTNTSIYIEDRYATANSMPSLDPCNDWFLVGGRQGFRPNGQPWTAIEARRPLTSPDKDHDRDIVAGDMQLIWAYGSSDTFGYHGQNRKPFTLAFYEDPDDKVKEKNVKTLTIGMDNYAGPIVRTHYGCISAILPQDKVRDIIAISATIDPENPIGIHHMNLFVCDTNDTWWDAHYNNADNCFVANGIPMSTSCINNIYAAGSTNPGTLHLPKDIAYRMGPGWYKYVAIQIHYDNPNLISWTDSTKIHIHYTEKLRQHPAAALLIGDVNVRGWELPPGVPTIDRQYDCPTNCTELLPHPINVVGLFNHQHLTGKMIYTAHRRILPNGTTSLVRYVGRNEFFKFDWQYTGTIEPFVFYPGDELSVHCIYDTTSRTNTTVYGINSDDEMCNVILFYYPIANFSVCGFWRADKQTPDTATQCAFRNNNIDVPNPRYIDPPEWSERIWGRPDADPHCY